jgi:GMP synthase (glutamine-hydrolysing)
MILLVDCGSNKTGYIQSIVQVHYPCERIGLLELTDDLALSADGVIFSGAPILLTEVDYDPYLRKIAWLDRFNKPILGICFGHQLIGLHYGASVSRQRDDRGNQVIAVLATNPLFDDLPDEFDMIEDHCESISVPAGFELSATSDMTVNEAMFHKNKPVFGVQFHPEVSGENGLILLKNFTKLVQAFQ